MENEFPRGTETLLLVDGKEQLRQGAVSILEDLGYKVLRAATADQALHLATLSNVHLLLVDVVLPEMSGLELAEKIFALRPGIHVLFSSASTSEELPEDRTGTLPSVGFIRTPFSRADIAHALRDLLDTPIPPPDTMNSASHGTESILVVDEDPQSRRSTTRVLRNFGYHILEAQYPDRALAISKNSKINLVVMDGVMDQMPGLELARAITGFKSRVRFLFLSAGAPEEFAPDQCPGEAEPAFLRRPFTSSELGRAVRDLLDAPLRP